MLKLLFLVLFLVSIFLTRPLAYAEPAETRQLTLTRTASSPGILPGELSKNEYKVETISVPYIEKIPYEATETYEEKIPYQVEEDYTETKVSYENEQRCHTETVPVRRHVCRNETTYERDCNEEPVCHRESSSPVCRTENICRTDHNGRETCFDKEVCRSGSGGREVCENRRVCRNAPTTREVCDWEDSSTSEQKCEWVQVPREHHEVRRGMVTRYRTETRTRKVTRYREEERCCRPEQVKKFDHQWKVSVQLRIPREALLNPKEKETSLVELSGTKLAPQVKLTFKSKIYGYQITSETWNGDIFTVDVAVVPAHKTADLGPSRILNLKLSSLAQNPKVTFADMGLRPRIDTTYLIEVFDLATNKSVAKTQAKASAKNKIEVPLRGDFPLAKNYKIVLQVNRSGINIDQPLQFTMEARQKIRHYTAEELGERVVSKMQIHKVEESRYWVAFHDLGVVENVDTRYYLQIFEEESNERVFNVEFAPFDDDDEQMPSSTEIPTGVLRSDADYIFKIRIERKGLVLDRPISFEISGRLDGFNTKKFADSSKVSPPTLRGLGQEAVLVFTDHAPLHEKVRMRYHVLIHRKAGLLGTQQELIADAWIERASLKEDGSGKFQISLASLGVSPENLNKSLKKGKVLSLELVVIRVLSLGEEPITFTKTTEVKVQ